MIFLSAMTKKLNRERYFSKSEANGLICFLIHFNYLFFENFIILIIVVKFPMHTCLEIIKNKYLRQTDKKKI